MSADRPTRVTPSGAGTRRSLIIAVVVSALALGLCAWLIVTDAPAYRFVVRLYEDKQLMHAMLARWGVLAPVVFIAIQALQVIIAPIPGEVTGLLGGFVFGPWLCFFIYLIPGLPKDIVCYLFGVSPMPFWVFAVVSTLGRMPGTWALSAQGAKAAAGEYVQLILLTTIVVAVALPLYYYRARIVAWFQGRG